MLEDVKQYWPLISSGLGVLLGGAVTWATAKTKIDNLLTNHEALSKRIQVLEQAKETDRVALADRLARIEVTLNAVHIRMEANQARNIILSDAEFAREKTRREKE